MSEITKGKWFLSSYQTKARNHTKIEVIASVSISEGVIKRIATISGTNAEAKANARLIASAPELYDTVYTLLDYAYEALHLAGGENEIRGNAPRILRDIQDCQKLLARIEGKEKSHDEEGH